MFLEKSHGISSKMYLQHKLYACMDVNDRGIYMQEMPTLPLDAVWKNSKDPIWYFLHFAAAAAQEESPQV